MEAIFNLLLLLFTLLLILINLGNRQLLQIGKQASRLYQERHGTKPIQREQFVGGATRMVNVYSFSDVDLLDQAIFLVMDK